MSQAVGTPDHPLRVAIVGSGPAGAYAAGHLLGKKAPLTCEVDVFDRLPTPWGLVRSGVAPDHPNIKAVTRVYEKTAGNPGFRFFGNVTFGTQITQADLADRYHAIIYAVGTQTDKRMGIPGEDLVGSHGAAEFVAWYNGHPDFRELEFDLDQERAVVIGNGNVAMDVARILALTTEELAKTDIADHALEVLASSSIREIVVLGRRGPAQAAFTNPEILEMGELADADVVVDPGHCELDPHSSEWLETSADGTSKRNVEILTNYSGREPMGKRKRVVFEFMASPIELLGEHTVEGVVVARNELVPGDDGSLRAAMTDERQTLECGLVLRSIGYRGVRSPACPSTIVPAGSPTTAAACSTAGRRSPASTSRAGSSAGPRVSSGPTRRTRRRPSTSSSQMPPTASCWPRQTRPASRSTRCSPGARPTTSPTAPGKPSTRPRRPQVSSRAARG